MKNAFISHSSKDDSFVSNLEKILISDGEYTSVFNDIHSINPGGELWPTITRGIDLCDKFIVVISPESIKSDWVRDEVKYARDCAKTIQPIRIAECPIPEFLKQNLVVDLYQEYDKLTEKERQEAARKLLAIKNQHTESIANINQPIKLLEAMGRVIRSWFACVLILIGVTVIVLIAWQWNEREGLKSDINKLEGKSKNLEGELVIAENNLSSALSSKADTLDELAGLKKELKAEEKKFKNENMKLSKLDEELTKVRNDFEKKSKEVKVKQEEIGKVNAELAEAQEKIVDLKSRTICVIDSSNRRRIMGIICGELSTTKVQIGNGRRNVLLDQEPIPVVDEAPKELKSWSSKKRNDFFIEQIKVASKSFKEQIKSIGDRKPAVLIMHIHTLRPEGAGGDYGPVDQYAARQLLSALTALNEFRNPPDIILFSRGDLYQKISVDGESVPYFEMVKNNLPENLKNIFEKMQENRTIHIFKVPLKSSTEETTSLEAKVSGILKKRLSN